MAFVMKGLNHHSCYFTWTHTCFSSDTFSRKHWEAIIRSCSWKCYNIHRKTPVLESLFNKAAGQACNFIKKRLQNKAFSFRFCETFKKVFFTEHGRLLLIIAYINEIWPTLFHKVTTKFGKVDQQFYLSNLIKLILSCTCNVKYSKLSLNTVNYRSDI